MTRLVIDLQDDLAGGLARIARREGTTEAHVAGKAVEEYVRHHERGQLFQEMREYAEELAAHSGGLVAESGPAVDQLLLEETDW